MLKKLLISLILVAPITMVAQDKIAFVNSQEIMYKMPELKDVEAKMAAKKETITKTLKEIEQEFTTKSEDFQKSFEMYQKDNTSVSETVLQDKQKSVAQIQQRYEEFANSSSAEMEKLQYELLGPINEKLKKAIKEVGDEQGYTYIVEGGVLLYTGSKAIDANKLVKTKVGVVE